MSHAYLIDDRPGHSNSEPQQLASQKSHNSQFSHSANIQIKMSQTKDLEKSDPLVTENSDLSDRLEKLTRTQFIQSIFQRRSFRIRRSGTRKEPSGQSEKTTRQLSNLAALADPQIGSVDERVQYVILMLRSLTSNYCPNYKIMNYFRTVSAALGLPQASLSLLPGCALLSVEQADGKLSSWNVHTSGGLNMERLEGLEIVIDNLLNGWYSNLQDAMVEMKAIATLPSAYPRALKVLAFGGICLGATPMFNGSAIDTLLSFVLGIAFGWTLFYGSDLMPGFASTFDFWTSALFSLIARALIQLVGLAKARDSFYSLPCNFIAIILPPLIWILPGFAMINGFVDFLHGLRTLGITNIFNALFVALNIGFGILVGFYSLFWIPAPIVEGEVLPTRMAYMDLVTSPSLKIYGWLLPQGISNHLANILLFMMCIFFVSITFDINPKQLPSILVVATLAYFTVDYSFKGGSLFGIGKSLVDSSRSFVLSFLANSQTKAGKSLITDSASFGFPEPIIFLMGGFVAGSLGTLYSHLTGYSSTPVVFLSIVILAPGTYGARAFFHFARSNFVEGVFRFLGMMFVALAIAVGIIFGRAVMLGRK